MSLRNRVDPLGAIHAVPERGMRMGNRGCLHDARRNIVREWGRKAWIICLLEYKGRHRQVMSPGSYTELFFLDEATALAAGHRPCGTCQRERLREFTRLWQTVNSADVFSLSALDGQLHHERYASAGSSALWSASLANLPGGIFVLPGGQGQPCLWDGVTLRPWSCAGYGERVQAAVDEEIPVLTPRSIVRVIAAGFRPQIAGDLELEKQSGASSTPPRAGRSKPSARPAEERVSRSAVREEAVTAPTRTDQSLYRLKTTPRGKELNAYFAAILRVTGMEEGGIYPLKRFLGNFSGHLKAGRIERVSGGNRLTPSGKDYFQDRYQPGNPRHVDESTVSSYVRLIRSGGSGWEPID